MTGILYNGEYTVAIMKDVYEYKSDIVEVLQAPKDSLSSDIIRELNYEVDVGEKSVEEVAQ